jgi:hypothetical protein
MASLVVELKNHGWTGRTKKECSDRDRVRKSVGVAIRRAVKQIIEHEGASSTLSGRIFTSGMTNSFVVGDASVAHSHSKPKTRFGGVP